MRLAMEAVPENPPFSNSAGNAVQEEAQGQRQPDEQGGQHQEARVVPPGDVVVISMPPAPGQPQAQAQPQRGRLDSREWPPWLQRLQRLLGMQGPHRAQVRYPPHFKALAAIVLCVSISWVGNYLLVVLPAIQDTRAQLCTYNQYNDSQLTYNAKMLFVYFLWFAFARASLFTPCIASRVAVVQSRTHGFCRTYCVHLIIRDGPLYIFVVGSMLFWFHLMQSPTCEEKNPDLYQTLKLYAIYSCMVSLLCLLLAYWHNKLLVEAVRDVFEPQDQSAPPDTINRLETRAYDENFFGDEEEKPYPAECAICLCAWEPDDVIKITHCHHAFHEECLGNWLRTARTCALCRQDLTKGPQPQPGRVGGPAALRGASPMENEPVPAEESGEPEPTSTMLQVQPEQVPPPQRHPLLVARTGAGAGNGTRAQTQRPEAEIDSI